MFKDKRDKKDLAEDVSHKLVYEYPEHSFAICCSEAEHLGLNIVKAERVQAWDSIWQIYLSLSRAGVKTVKFLNRNKLNEVLGVGR
jgi:hypothetical protein